jgi:hypothetical protein
LAVIDEGGRFLGAVSRESIGKARIATKDPCLADTIAPATVVGHDALLADAACSVGKTRHAATASRRAVTGSPGSTLRL